MNEDYLTIRDRRYELELLGIDCTEIPDGLIRVYHELYCEMVKHDTPEAAKKWLKQITGKLEEAMTDIQDRIDQLSQIIEDERAKNGTYSEDWDERIKEQRYRLLNSIEEDEQNNG